MPVDFHVGFTGTSNPKREVWDDLSEVLFELTQSHERVVLHHGDCVGMDNQAHILAVKHGISIVIHPPKNPRGRAFCESNHGGAVLSSESPRPYLDRNQDIVDESSLLIAVPKNPEKEELRSGTWATVRRARKKGIPIKFV